MNMPALPKDILAMIRPVNLVAYAQHTGWRLMPAKMPGIAILERKDPRRLQILVPTDTSFLDYLERVAEVVQYLARWEKRSDRELLSELLHTPSDILRYRIKTSSTEDGFIAFPQALDLLDACKQSLLASACTVIEPKRFYSRLSRRNSDAFLSACRLGTEKGSFVATVQCPLNAVSEDDEEASDKQLALPGVSIEQRPTFARRTVETLMRSTARLVHVLDNSLSSEMDGEELLSANLCEAIAQMEPLDGANGDLYIECQWSRMIPRRDVPSRVVIRKAHFPFILSVAQSLRPTENDPKPSTFAGRVDSLHGNPDQNELVGGDIVLQFQGEDRSLKARVTLLPTDYWKACDAHKSGNMVSLSGILIQRGRSRRIEQPSHFRDLTKENDEQ